MASAGETIEEPRARSRWFEAVRVALLVFLGAQLAAAVVFVAMRAVDLASNDNLSAASVLVIATLGFLAAPVVLGVYSFSRKLPERWFVLFVSSVGAFLGLVIVGAAFNV